MTNVQLQPTVSLLPDIKVTGSINDLRNRGRYGEIAIYRGVPYIWLDRKWEPVDGPAKHVLTEPKKMKPVLCSQCGAPLHSSVCEYCGTEYR